MSRRSRGSTTKEGELIEVWGDNISVRDLLISLAITAAVIIAACVIATLQGQDILFWGMGGAIIGFILSVLVVRPKRDVQVVEVSQHADDEDAPSV